jgi:hypothetical protein
VALEAVGSNPIIHPNFVFVPGGSQRESVSRAPVAQLDRATDFGSVGCRFEPCRARHVVFALFMSAMIERWGVAKR